MGIFGFKNKFDIVPKEKDLSKIVNKFNSVGVIKINAKLVVPSGYFFVIGKKGKVCDIFDEGTHYFNYSSLPVMCRKYGIDKAKKSKVQDKIPADFYFVKKELVAGKFSTYRSVTMGTNAYGIFSARVYGVYSYRVNNVSEYMQSLLNEFDYIKTGEAEDILERWVNEASVNELEKQNFIIKDVIANSPIIADTLKIKMSKLFSVAGLELAEFKIVKYKLPKKYQLMQDEYFALIEQKERLDQPNKDVVQILNVEQNNKQSETTTEIYIENDKHIETPTEPQNPIKEKEVSNVLKQGYYDIESLDQDVMDAKNLLKEFGIEKGEDAKPEEYSTIKTLNLDNNIIKNNDIENANADNSEIKDLEKQVQGLTEEDINEAQEIKKQTIDYVPFGEFVIEDRKTDTLEQKAKEEKKEKTFVDLNVDELYNSTDCNKRCLNCGMENDKNANHCIICGEKFLKENKYD